MQERAQGMKYPTAAPRKSRIESQWLSHSVPCSCSLSKGQWVGRGVSEPGDNQVSSSSQNMGLQLSGVGRSEEFGGLFPGRLREDWSSEFGVGKMILWEYTAPFVSMESFYQPSTGSIS